MADLTIDLKPTRIASAYIEAPFDVGIEALQKARYQIPFLEENAALRIQQGPQHDISRSGNWVKEGVIYLPDGRYSSQKTHQYVFTLRKQPTAIEMA